MASDRDLNSPDLGGSRATGFATAAMIQSAKGGPKWLRILVMIFTAIIVLVTLAGAFDKFTSMGSLPACDAQRTRDTLSDLNKQNQVNASKYNFIKKVSATDTEVMCVANLALRDGGTLEYDYRIYKEESAIKVQITNSRKQ